MRRADGSGSVKPEARGVWRVGVWVVVGLGWSGVGTWSYGVVAAGEVSMVEEGRGKVMDGFLAGTARGGFVSTESTDTMIGVLKADAE